MSAVKLVRESFKRVEPIVKLIVESYHPQRVILFGSQARGNATSESDYDLLIVAPSEIPRWQRTAPVYRLLAGTGIAKDIVWWTPEEIAEWRGVKSHFINTVLQEGQVLYENPA
jgi:predicted nucleotidyltransferase